MSTNILKLKTGDLIDVIAPSSRCSDEELSAGVKYLEQMGFRVRVPKDIFADHMYLANSDKVRFHQLKSALQARDSKAIWCARGGYGAGRLMPNLVKMKKPAVAKALIGLSDITALHIWLNCAWKWPSWHAPILSRLGSTRASSEERVMLHNVLVGDKTEISIGSLQTYNLTAKKWSAKKVRQPLRSSGTVGGNLVLVESSLGTDWQIKTKNKILFLEDAGERGYRLDRSLHHLQQAGIFANVVAVILGDFTGGEEATGQSLVQPALTEFFETLTRVPVFSGIPSGHGPVQLPIPFGVKTEIRSETSREISIQFKI